VKKQTDYPFLIEPVSLGTKEVSFKLQPTKKDFKNDMKMIVKVAEGFTFEQQGLVTS